MIQSVTRASVSQVVSNAIDYTTPATASTANKIVSKIGGVIISAMVAEKAVVYVDSEIAGFVEGFNKKKDDTLEVESSES